MYKDINKLHEYQREYHKRWRREHPKENAAYNKIRNERYHAKEESLEDFRGKMPKIRKERIEKIKFRKGKCQICDINIGPKYMEKEAYIWRGYKICGACYAERNRN